MMFWRMIWLFLLIKWKSVEPQTTLDPINLIQGRRHIEFYTDENQAVTENSLYNGMGWIKGLD